MTQIHRSIDNETYEETVPRYPNCRELNHSFLEQHQPVKNEFTYSFECPDCGWQGEVDCYEVVTFHVHS